MDSCFFPQNHRLIERLESRIAPAVFMITKVNEAKLKQAIIDANDSAEADTITILSGRKVALHADLPEITGDLTITWAGANPLRIDGNKHQIFGITGPALTVNISNLKLMDGKAANGGAISIDSAGGKVALSDLTIFKNKATVSGGGVAVKNGEVTITNSVLEQNTAGESGGGLFVAAGATAKLSGTQVNTNSVTGVSADELPEGEDGGSALGGGIFNAGTLSVAGNSVITGNTATGGAGAAGVLSETAEGDGGYGGTAQGGGIYNDATGTVTIVDSSITGNTAEGGRGGQGHKGTKAQVEDYAGYGYAGGQGGGGSGGGVFNLGSLTIQTSTISGLNMAKGGAGGAGGKGGKGNDNYAGGDGGYGGEGGYGLGGGIYSGADATLTVEDSTISGNQAAGGVGGAGGKAGKGEVVYDGETYRGYAGEDGEAGTGTGGGVHSTLGTLTFTKAKILLNTADSGGGLSIDQNISTTISALSEIKNNKATELGGGMLVILDLVPNPVNVIASIIADNTCLADPTTANVSGIIVETL